MPADSFGAAGTLTAGGVSYQIFRVHAIERAARLPYCLKVLLENLLRNEDGHLVTAAQIQALAGWDPAAEPSAEIAFTPARVLLQDFTGVPCLVDLAAMREAMTALGGDPSKVSPLRSHTPGSKGCGAGGAGRGRRGILPRLRPGSGYRQPGR